MTETKWLTRGGFHWFENEPLYSRVTARQLALLSAAWLRRFDRFWAPLPASDWVSAILARNDEMRLAFGYLDRWADGAAGPLERGDAEKNARDAAESARALFEHLVEDNDDGLIRFRAEAADSAARAFEFVCELLHLCGTPGRRLADALAPFASPARPDPPAFVLLSERRRPRSSSTRQRVLDLLEDALRDLSQVVADAAGWRSEDQNRVYNAESHAEQELMHEVFGNPFRPIEFATDWHTGTATAIARQMYDTRDFSAMPILADALQDAGCDNAAVLTHCRDANQVHVRGCWVVDLVLGKE